MVVYYWIRFSLWCLTPLATIFQLYRAVSLLREENGVPGENHRLSIAERLLISISVERGMATLPRFLFTRGPTLKCMTMPWLTIQIGNKILSDEYSIIILTGQKITYENGRQQISKHAICHFLLHLNREFPKKDI
jgi:hypothetical protein